METAIKKLEELLEEVKKFNSDHLEKEVDYEIEECRRQIERKIEHEKKRQEKK